MNIGYGRTATSPILAHELAMLREHDRFEMNRDRIYSQSIRALNTSQDQKPFSPSGPVDARYPRIRKNGGLA